MLRTVVNAILLSSALALPSASPDALPFDLPTELPAPGPLGKRAGYPFSRIVAFGDNLSDNGSGSVAHGVAQQGDPSNKIYGYSKSSSSPLLSMPCSHVLLQALGPMALLPFNT